MCSSRVVWLATITWSAAVYGGCSVWGGIFLWVWFAICTATYCSQKSWFYVRVLPCHFKRIAEQKSKLLGCTVADLLSVRWQSHNSEVSLNLFFAGGLHSCAVECFHGLGRGNKFELNLCALHRMGNYNNKYLTLDIFDGVLPFRSVGVSDWSTRFFTNALLQACVSACSIRNA